ncbi:LacI family DNA-binding transcriptional regulator [Cohnella sp. GCM10027633]|uniref:LacI family DNA-binding transcriptional regulator n=1 Tax=unclassified Cohnella TaxID=2636738 RepID=UPI00364503A1
MPIRKSVTLRTIATELGLTVQTVSKALKGKPGMSEETRRLVVRTAEKLGYYTSEQIRSLKVDRIAPYPSESMHFLLALTDASASYIRELLNGLQERFYSFGHRIEQVILPRHVQAKDMPDWIEAKGMNYADGVFIAPTISPEAWERALFGLQAPRILLNFPPPGLRLDSVIWDVYEAAYQSVSYLRELGHERILYVGDIHRQRGYILRWQAFVYAMDKLGAGSDSAPRWTGRRDDDREWMAELRSRLDAYRPTAVVCGIHEDVSAVYSLCLERGWRVPEDVSLVGFLNEQPAELPPFTRPLLPIRDTGYRAADRMLWRIANPTLPYEHIRIQSELFVGGTTAAPRA